MVHIRTMRLAGIMVAISLSILTLPVQAFEDYCTLPKTNYPIVYCTNDASIFFAMDNNHDPKAFLNSQGEVIIDLQIYDDIDFSGMRGGIFPVLKDGKVGYMSSEGLIVVPTIYDKVINNEHPQDEYWAKTVSDKRIIVSKNGKYGVIDIANKVIVPFDNPYNYITDYHEGRAAVRDKNGKWGFIDVDGVEVIAPQYDSLYDHERGYYGFWEGLVGVKNGKKWGFITDSGKVAVPFIYDAVQPFSEGLAGVLKDGNWGFINGANETVIPFQFSDTNAIRTDMNHVKADYFYFFYDEAKVAPINNKSVCIDRSGQQVDCYYHL